MQRRLNIFPVPSGEPAPIYAGDPGKGDDPNHFAPKSFGKGFGWQLPDLEGSARAYRPAKEACEQAGRQMLDATIGGKLCLFPIENCPGLF